VCHPFSSLPPTTKEVSEYAERDAMSLDKFDGESAKFWVLQGVFVRLTKSTSNQSVFAFCDADFVKYRQVTTQLKIRPALAG
jgi:hypothetical protein